MENTNPILDSDQSKQFGSAPITLPNSVGVLVLGIISIALCWCYGIVGLTTGIIALILGGRGKKLYAANPEAYTLASFKNLKAGWICAIVGTCLSALYVIVVVIYIVVVGVALTTMPWHMLNK
jgi:hypothetical protein